jgi:hypothetical protein
MNESDAQEMARIAGATDRNKSATMLQKGWHSKYELTWQIRRHRNTTIFSGHVPGGPVNDMDTGETKQPPQKIKWSCFFDENWALEAKADPEYLTPDQVASELSPPALVWKCSDSSIYFPSPSLNVALKRPEPCDFVLMTGANPLKLYGADFQLVKIIGEQYILKSSPLKGIHFSCYLRLTLDSRYGFSPSSIEMFMGQATVPEKVWRVTRHRSVNADIWLPSEIEYHSNSQGHKQVIKFVLNSFNDSREVVMELPTGFPVGDMRLINENPTERDSIQRGDKMIRYSWTGQVPSEVELRQMAFTQGKLDRHQGVRMSWLLLLPGLFLLGLAVYFYRKMQTNA